MTANEDRDYNLVEDAFQDLLNSIEYKTEDADNQLITRAFQLAKDAHKGVRRKSGEPYITHPISVAQIVATEIGLGPTSIATALMHDVVEDSDYTLEDIENMFNPNIARLIDGLTKISGVVSMESSMQLENYRKMLLTISDDVRVILIKLADRLHNMRTMQGMPAHKQLKIASETLFIYAPLAHRLGLFRIKTELEDISLKYTEHEMFEDLSSKMEELVNRDFEYLNKFTRTVSGELKKAGLKFEVKKRTKSIFSIRRKMRNQQVSFDEVYDKYAIRIILDSKLANEKSDCWKSYSVVTENYSPNPNRLRDWISSPKSNGYESLHSTVMGPEGHWVEVQIRTKRMDDIAENGFAAHWKYKEDSSGSNQLDSWLRRIREFLDNPDNDNEDFIDSFKMNLFSSEIFVFTPRGEMVTLPKGATALDFAFDVHSEVGAHCLGTKVNGKLVPLSSPLKSGDQIEVLTSMKQEPKEDWLSFVKTGKAKQRIRQSLKKEKQLITGQGQMTLERKLKVLKLKSTHSNIQKLVNYFGLKNPDELFYKVGLGVIDNKKLREYARETAGLVNYFKRRIVKSSYAKQKPLSKEAKKDLMLVFGTDEHEMEYTLAKCCNPVPGDRVFGFVTTAEGLKVHRDDCPNAVLLQSRFANRTLKAKWVDKKGTFATINLFIEGMDRIGLVNDVTKVISSELSLNIKAISFAVDDGLFTGQVTIEVADKVALTDTITNIKQLEGISTVSRVGKFG
ncbi:MAG: bifunctional (p)ppGpp synthetase/guanosine-3',5'-bis(diphosphate) 3'-pyrophosphohydrolase [Schleiferiaceae bacterium]|nr:bifunctional (p)ppGpp synthetase/guanosine-3',5'-bis(diphosphate) 3'-pyrophosphohydrolase [Schleiferiaceae bacterium]